MKMKMWNGVAPVECQAEEANHQPEERKRQKRWKQQTQRRRKWMRRIEERAMRGHQS